MFLARFLCSFIYLTKSVLFRSDVARKFAPYFHPNPTSLSDGSKKSLMNELPDDILVLILSNLTMKEAARTTVLSHRWEKLGVRYAWSLNFDLPDATLRLRYGTADGSVERARFIGWVNHILNLHRGSTVDEFRVFFDLDACDGDDIERWIKFAIEKKVCRFELDFSHFGLHARWTGGYQFPFKLLDLPNNLSRSFGSLTSLRLNSVDLSDQVVAYFLSNCQSLEQLSIKGASSLTYLNATTALKLKHLEIQRCKHLKKVDIINTIIESLNFYGEWLVSPSLQELHLLKEVSLCGSWCTRLVRSRFLQLPISQLQRLELDIGRTFLMGSIKWEEVFPTFCNLKHLEVILVAGHYQNIFCLTSLICASPLLSSFILKP
ncbi:UDP-glycosyltransferase [Orobanche gracilis]